mmetsp:Transcript_12369/g.18492  ORF Transcript_12369/g.18492 Transcript_12369/m.18492 type:complete len:117 (-) Transcript_12369:7048-7398(-)
MISMGFCSLGGSLPAVLSHKDDHHVMVHWLYTLRKESLLGGASWHDFSQQKKQHEAFGNLKTISLADHRSVIQICTTRHHIWGYNKDLKLGLNTCDVLIDLIYLNHHFLSRTKVDR